MGRVLIIMVLGAVGYFAGMLLASATAPEPVDPAPTPREPVAPPAATAPATGEQDATEPDLAATIQSELETLRAAAESASIPILPDATLEGRVVDENMRPVAGITVHARAYPHEGRWDYTRNPSLLERAVRTIEHDIFREVRAREAVTEASGRFRIENLAADARYQVQPEHESYKFEPRVSPLEPGESVTIVASWVGRPVITVLMPDGSRPPSAKLESQRNNTQTASRWTPDAPLGWGLQVGTHRLRARHEHYRSEDVIVTVVEGEAVDPITLHLEPIPQFRVLIRLPRGDQAESIDGRYRLLKPGEVGTRELLASGRELSQYVQSEPPVLRDLTPGRYLLGVGRHNRIELIQEVELGNEPMDVEFEFPPISDEQTITARVWESDEPSLGRCRFHLHYKRPRRESWWRLPAVRQADGCYALILDEQIQAELDHPDTEFALSVEVTHLGKQRIPITVPVPDEVDFRYEPAATCHLIVTASPADEYGRVTVILRRRAADGGWQPTDSIRRTLVPTGELQFSHHESGEYELRVQRGRRDFIVHREPVTIRPGANRIDVTLPPLRRVTVTVEEEIERLWCRLERESEGGVALPDAHDPHWFEFRVPDGEYKLAYSSRATSGTRLIEVRGDREIPLAPVLNDGLLVELLATSGPLVDSGFEVGDLIVEVEGKAMRGDDECRQAIARLRHASGVAVTVLRGDEELQITTVRRDGVLPGRLGGQLAPHRQE